MGDLLSISLEVVRKYVSESLTPVLVGCIGTFVYIFFVLKLPERIEEDRRLKILNNKRQKVIAAMLQRLLQREGKQLEVSEYEALFSEDSDYGEYGE